MDWLSEIFTGKEPVLFAGAAGGFVRWVTLKEKFLEGVASIAVGAICSLYLSPLAEPVIASVFGSIHLTDPQRAGFSGFVIGTSGTLFAGLVIDAVRGFRRKPE